MKKFKLLLIAMLILPLAGCQSVAEPSQQQEQPQEMQTAEAADYFPILENVRYDYEGIGDEYATYSVWIDYASETKMQQRTDDGGTESVSVIEITGGKATRLLRSADVAFRENCLDATAQDEEILLMEPIAVGTTWTVNGTQTREIVGVDVDIKTPSGSYKTVAVRTNTAGGANTINYYAADVGLVKSVYADGDFEVTSTLSAIVQNAPFTQAVRFYYPKADGSCFCLEREVCFYTNDSTQEVLQTAYQESTEDGVGAVFSQNTQINLLYLGQDGAAHIDLNGAFISEMDISGHEADILQCLANTFGEYYGVGYVCLTIDGALYDSGNISLIQGEYLTVDTTGEAEGF